MMNDEAKQQATEIPAVTGIGDISTGLGSKDPAVQSKINDIMKLRAGDYGRAAIGGAAMGAQAATGAASPLNAFIQGMAAGLQAPAKIYQQKREQVKSVMDATPFGVTHPEVVKDPAYQALAGLPTGLVLPAIAKIAEDSVRIYNEGTAKSKEQAEKFKYDIGLKSFEASLKGKDPAKYEDISAMAKDFRSLEPVVQYQTAKAANEMIKQAPDDGAGDLMIMANYARILNPQTRFSEGNLEATDVSSTFDKYTMGLWNRVVEGKRLSTDERNKLRAASIKAFNIRKNEYSNVANIWEEKASELGLDPDFIVSDKGWETKYIGGKPVMARPLPNGKWEVKP